MLVLTRKLNESLKIGSDIEITIIGIEGERVKLGIKAPRSIEVYRKELYEAIQNENKKASQSLPTLEQLDNLLKKD